MILACLNLIPSLNSNLLNTYMYICISCLSFFIYLPNHISVYQTIYLSIKLSTYLSSYLSVYETIHLFIKLSICLSNNCNLSVYQTVSINQSIYLYAKLNIYQTIYLSIKLSIFLKTSYEC